LEIEAELEIEVELGLSLGLFPREKVFESHIRCQTERETLLLSMKEKNMAKWGFAETV